MPDKANMNGDLQNNCTHGIKMLKKPVATNSHEDGGPWDKFLWFVSYAISMDAIVTQVEASKDVDLKLVY